MAKDIDADVILLAEHKNVNKAQLLFSLNSSSVSYELNPDYIKGEKIYVISKYGKKQMQPIFKGSRFTIWLLSIPNCDPLILAGIHFHDQMSFNKESREEAALEFIFSLSDVEKTKKCTRSVVIGDFNMNPFDDFMIKSKGFFSTMSSEFAKKGVRTIDGKDYPIFYNPSWGLYGDLKKNASGTYFYYKSQHVHHHWNIFDQVLIRPSLIPNFRKESLKIIEQVMDASLLKKGNVPNDNEFSDHLPLTLTFDI